MMHRAGNVATEAEMEMMGPRVQAGWVHVPA